MVMLRRLHQLECPETLENINDNYLSKVLLSSCLVSEKLNRSLFMEMSGLHVEFGFVQNFFHSALSCINSPHKIVSHCQTLEMELGLRQVEFLT